MIAKGIEKIEIVTVKKISLLSSQFIFYGRIPYHDYFLYFQ